MLLSLSASISQAQFQGFRGFRGFRGFFQPVQHMFHHTMHTVTSPFQNVQMPHFGMPNFRMPRFFGGESNSIGNGNGNKGTESPQATGIDSLYPEDCGRDDNNKGLLCFPDGLLCQERKKC